MSRQALIVEDESLTGEALAVFLRRLRALRMREGLSLDGLAAQGNLPPGSDAAGQSGFTITRLGPRLAPRHGPRRNRWRPSPGLIGVTATAMVLAGLAAGGVVLMEPTGHSESSAPSAPLPGGGRSMANRGSVSIDQAGSHSVYVSKPREVAEIIEKAAKRI